MTIYEQVGGEPFFVDLVERFYQGVQGDPVLRPLYPQDDMEGAKRRLHLFLMQSFRGPATYNQERARSGASRCSVTFSVGEAERDAWMTHMRAALVASEAVGPIQAAMLDYFENTATFLRNK